MLYLVGITPEGVFSPRAAGAVGASRVLFGAPACLAALGSLGWGKETHLIQPGQEAERAALAVQYAREQETALVCLWGGEWASLLPGFLEPYPEVELEVIPAMPIWQEAAGALGDPLGDSYMHIRLGSPRAKGLLRLGGSADLALCLLPGEGMPLGLACGILLGYRDPATLCGLVRRAGRSGESRLIMSLECLKGLPAGSFSAAFIGCSRTVQAGGYLVTLRE